MDPEAFLDLANQVTKLKMYPYFEIAHCVLCALMVRDDLGSGALAFSRKHPMALWLSTLVTVFAGGLISNFLLGEPILGVLKNSNQVVITTVAWYLVFYTPFDIGYKVAKFLPIKVILAAMKEVSRCRKVHDGVTHAVKVFPNSYLILIIIGTIKGNGSTFLLLFERLVRGVWTPTAMEVMQPSFATKACIVASSIFVLDKKTDFISAPHALVYFGITIFFVYFKMSSLLLGIHDPFVPFENLFCAVFMGGICDTVQRAISGGRGSQAETKNESAKNGKTESAKKKD